MHFVPVCAGCDVTDAQFTAACPVGSHCPLFSGGHVKAAVELPLLLQALQQEHVSIATGSIDTFTTTGVRLSTRQAVAADLVIVCTGFNLLPLGGVKLSVDGAPMELGTRMMYKGFQPEGVPNLAVVIGYLNASWTLRVNLIGRYICRLMKHMDETATRSCTPRWATRASGRARLRHTRWCAHAKAAEAAPRSSRRAVTEAPVADECE